MLGIKGLLSFNQYGDWYSLPLQLIHFSVAQHRRVFRCFTATARVSMAGTDCLALKVLDISYNAYVTDLA
jgi:hypothetical protein